MAARGDKGLFFLGGALFGAAGIVLWNAFSGRPTLSPWLIPGSREHPGIPATVIVPGIIGSQLLRRPTAARCGSNSGNAFGYHDLRLPARLPLADSLDDLLPKGLIGVGGVLPQAVRLHRVRRHARPARGRRLLPRRAAERARGAIYHVFAYDWRRDLVESARRLGQSLDALADLRGEPDARFNLVGHSMGGLVARYYLRYGGAEPGGPVTWGGARRIENLVLVATPNGGSIASLDAVLRGNRVGLSATTLAASVIARMPAIYQLLPPRGTKPLLAALRRSTGPRAERRVDLGAPRLGAVARARETRWRRSASSPRRRSSTRRRSTARSRSPPPSPARCR